MTEQELTDKIFDLAAKLRLLAHHCPRSRMCRGNRGFPDLIIAGPRGVIFAELKSEDGETSADQDNWAYILMHSAQSYRIWRPAGYSSGSIEWQMKELLKPW